MQPDALTRPAGISTTRGTGPPGRGFRVSERVTKPPRSARSPYAASSRPVPPQPEATSTGFRQAQVTQLDGQVGGGVGWGVGWGVG